MKSQYKPQTGIRGFVLLSILLTSYETTAQLNPMVVTYYENQYLTNPAMAGLDSGLKLNCAYRQQWSSVPGAPKNQSVTADVNITTKVGLGIILCSDQAGLLKRMRAMGTYSYHIPINGNDQRLSFGISIGLVNEKIDYKKIKGEDGDQAIPRFNQREAIIDGDFGTAFTSRNLTIQAAIPNMKSFFNKDDAGNTEDRSLFFTALSYKFYVPDHLDGVGVEPKVCYRGVRGCRSLADVGVNLTFSNNTVNLMTVYHSSQNLSYGMGIFYQKTISFSGIYTTETSALRKYTNGTFEVAVRLNLS